VRTLVIRDVWKRRGRGRANVGRRAVATQAKGVANRSTTKVLALKALNMTFSIHMACDRHVRHNPMQTIDIRLISTAQAAFCRADKNKNISAQVNSCRRRNPRLRRPALVRFVTSAQVALNLSASQSRNDRSDNDLRDATAKKSQNLSAQQSLTSPLGLRGYVHRQEADEIVQRLGTAGGSRLSIGGGV